MAEGSPGCKGIGNSRGDGGLKETTARMSGSPDLEEPQQGPDDDVFHVDDSHGMT